jgi:hypothetical protein
MDGSFSTGQSPKWAVLPVEEEYFNYIIVHRYAAASQSTNEVFLMTELSAALVRNSVCSVKMIELSKHVAAN